MEDLVAYFDGSFMKKSEIKLDIDNLGFTRGYGAYECFRTYGRSPFHLNDHIERLKRTCKSLLLHFPQEDLFQITKELIDKNQGSDLIFRLFVIDSNLDKPYHLVIICNTSDHFKYSNPTHPLAIKSVLDTRSNIGVKSTNYATTLIEVKKAKMLGFDDVLFIGEDQFVHELARANIVGIKDQTLITPKSYLLAGITRLTLFEIAKDYGFEMKEEDLTLDSLLTMEEVFACATIRGISPIRQIDEKKFTCFKKTELLKSYFTNLSALALT